MQRLNHVQSVGTEGHISMVIPVTISTRAAISVVYIIATGVCAAPTKMKRRGVQGVHANADIGQISVTKLIYGKILLWMTLIIL